MHYVIHTTPQAFADRALRWLERDPVVNSMVMSITQGRLTGAVVDPAPPLWLTVTGSGGEVVGAAVRTPPRLLVLPDLPVDVAKGIARYLHDQRRGGVRVAELPGVVGTVVAAEAFAARWTQLTGAVATVEMRQRIFRLDRVRPPSGVAGHFRFAEAPDLDLCLEWFAEFRGEALPQAPPFPAALVQASITGRRLGLWVDGERVVSLVGAGVPAAGIVRIGPVYTPRELRGRGYASAATAAVSQRALDAGAVACTLNTDLSNPTSNAIYQRIGYVPVADAMSLLFEPVD